MLSLRDIKKSSDFISSIFLRIRENYDGNKLPERKNKLHYLWLARLSLRVVNWGDKMRNEQRAESREKYNGKKSKGQQILLFV